MARREDRTLVLLPTALGGASLLTGEGTADTTDMSTSSSTWLASSTTMSTSSCTSTSPCTSATPLLSPSLLPLASFLAPSTSPLLAASAFSRLLSCLGEGAR